MATDQEYDAFNVLMDSLANGEGARIDGQGDDLSVIKLTALDVAALAPCNQDKVFYAVMLCRPGALDWATAVEHQLYPPTDYEQNDKFGMTFVRWEELMWAVISVPASDHDKICQLSETLSMKVATGIPIMLGGPQPVAFPVSGPNVYAIEGCGKEGYPGDHEEG